MRHAVAIRVGPATFRIGSDWEAPVAALRRLYAPYPPADAVPDFTVRLEATRRWRRWLRPQVALAGDFMLPDAAPLPLELGLLAAEMAMNLQMALGWRRHLLLHAAVVERDGRALILTGESGAGKSTLAASLMTAGWRLLGDEFALLDLGSGALSPFPRPISLKNESIALFADRPAAALGPLLRDTPKGDIRHLVPDALALAGMDDAATPALILFPRHGFASALRQVPASEAFVRLTAASTNYTALGDAGFLALTGLIGRVPALAVDYPDGASALAAIDRLWRDL